MIRFIVLLVLFFPVLASGADSAVFEHAVKRPADQFYDGIYKALEDRKMWVVFEANPGKNLAGMAKKPGDEYNRNGFESIRIMVVCNSRYVNAVSNADPAMLALCPLRVTVTHKAGVSTALFARPTAIAAGSPAEPVIREVEALVIEAIREGAGGE